MNRKYPQTSIGIVDSAIQKWYEAEQCWNCEPEQLRKMQIQKYRSLKKRF